MQALTTISKTIRREEIVKAAEEMNVDLAVSIETTQSKAKIVDEISGYLHLLVISDSFSDSSVQLFKKMGWEKSVVLDRKDISFYGQDPAIIYPEREEIDTYLNSLKYISLWKEGTLFGITSEFESGITTTRLFGNEEVAFHSFNLQSGNHGKVEKSPVKENTNTQGTILINEPPGKTRKDAVVLALQSEPETLTEWVSIGSEIYSAWGKKESRSEQEFYTYVVLEGIMASPFFKIAKIVEIFQQYCTRFRKRARTRVRATAIAIQEGIYEREALVRRSAEIYSAWGKKEHMKNTEFYVDVMLTGINVAESMSNR